MSDRHDVITPIQRGDKTFWTKIGSAWEKEPGRWSILLDAFPVNGKLMIVQPKPKDNRRRRDEPENAVLAVASSSEDIPF